MKKIKLPLEMANGVMVRTLDELKENWDLEKIVGYFGDGRLVTWLNDRYYTDLAEQVEKITAKGAEAQKELCAIFGVEFKQDEVVDADALAERKRKLDILRQFTSDDEILKNVDSVAFNQEDLADLLDEGVEKIYLCNGKFSVPLNISGKKYIGVADAEIYIGKDELQDFDKLGISFENVKFDEKYQKLVEEKNDSIQRKDDDIERLHKLAFFYSLKWMSGGIPSDALDIGLKKDIEIYEKLCDKGDKKAYYCLGKIYHYDSERMEEMGVTNCREKAKELYQKAIEAGNPDGYYGIGRLENNFQYIQKGAALGSKACQGGEIADFRIGDKSCGVSRDLNRAIKLAEKYQNLDALYMCYAYPYWPTPNYEPVKDNLEKAISYLIMDTENGNHHEMSIAYNYHRNLNNDEEAKKWIMRGIEQNEDIFESIRCFNDLHLFNYYRKKYHTFVCMMTYKEYLSIRDKIIGRIRELGVDDEDFIGRVVDFIPETEFER